MAARDRLFPASRHIVTKPETHFNARGAVNDPVFTLARPAGHKGISLKVQAQCLGDGKWIAEPIWESLCGHLPYDGMQPHTGSTIRLSRSEAVEKAIESALRNSNRRVEPQ